MQNYNLLELSKALNKPEYVLFPEISAQNGAAIRQSPLYSELDSLARSELGMEIAELPYSFYKLYGQTGSRSEFEEVYFARRHRLYRAAAMAIAGHSEFIDDVQNIMWAICGEFTWAFPAHMCGRENDVVLPPQPSEDGYIYAQDKSLDKRVDLFAAQTAAALAEVCYLLENKLDAMVKYRVRSEIRVRVLDQFIRVHG